MAVEKADTALSSPLDPSYVQYEVVVSPKDDYMLTITSKVARKCSYKS
jgi:hypothetical protein